MRILKRKQTEDPFLDTTSTDVSDVVMGALLGFKKKHASHPVFTLCMSCFHVRDTLSAESTELLIFSHSAQGPCR